MAVVPVHRLALLGGGFSMDDDGLLDDWVLAHARTARPKVCLEVISTLAVRSTTARASASA
ncbi:hypothetical protein ACWD4F_40045 [Streptomyces aureus]